MAPPRPTPPLITPDTNVIVSGTTLSNTPPGQIIQAWKVGQLEIALSEPILREIQTVLSRPYHISRTGWSPEQLDQYVNALRRSALVVPGTTPVHVCRDPKDNMVFACALEAQADYIVSGDRDVLAVGTYQGIATVTPREFVQTASPLEEAA